ncbi:MAG: tail fiber domain-containing protein [Pseudobdellovibrionaceae bacterium]
MFLLRGLFFSIAGFLFVFSLNSYSLAAPTSLTYQGRILKSDGTPLEYNNVSFIFQITDPSGQCVIYQEQVNGINMANSAGVFDVPIGNGTIQYPFGGTTTILDIFNNSSSFTCGSCSSTNGNYTCANGSGTYAASATDIRKLRVSFYDGSGWKLITPDNTVRSVPFAGYALSAQKLGTHVETDFLFKAGLPTCTAGTFLSYDGTSLTCVPVAGASGGTVTNVTSANSYLTIANNTSAPVLTLNVGTVANTVAAGNDPRLSDSRAPTGAAGGVLNGTYPNPGLVDSSVTNTKINDGAVSTSKLFATPGINRLVATDPTTGATLTPLTCASGQVLTWSVASGWQCTNQNSLAVGSASLAANFTGNLVGDVSGTQAATSVDKIKGVPLDFSTAPASGQVLKFNGTNWVPAADNNAGGTVTNVSSANVDIGVANGSSTPVLTLNSGTGANQIIKLDTSAKLPAVDGSQLTNLQASQIPNLSAAKITSGVLAVAQGGTGQSAYTDGQLLIGNTATNGLNKATLTAGTGVTITNGNGTISISATGTGGTVTNVTGTAPINVATGTSTPVVSFVNGSAAGQVHRWDGTSSWVATKLIYTDLVNASAGSPWPASTCTSGQAVTWSSVSDSFSCSTLTIATTQLSGTLAAAQMPAFTGDVTSTAGSVATTVASVGGSSAANINTAVVAVNTNATSSSTASVLVKRDVSGISNFKGLKLDGAASGTLTQTVPATVTSYSVTWPGAVAGTANSVLASDTSGNLSWINLGSVAGTISLTSQVTGVLPIANGGTNSSTGLTNNQLMFSNAGAIKELGAMTDGQIVVGKSAASPQIVSMSGDIAITNTGATTVGKINGTTVSGVGLANNNLLQNNSGSAISGNSVLVSNGTGTGVTALSTPVSSILTSTGGSVPTWSSISSDTFTQYALLAGRSGGQTLYGGTAASNNLTLDSTFNSTKGNVLINPSGGNVGIGTTSPTRAPLEVAGMVGNTSAIFGSGNAGVSLITSWPGIYFNGYFNGAAKSMAAGYLGEIIQSPTTGDIQFLTSTTAATAGDQTLTSTPNLTIKQNGYVGIGATTPVSKLHVAELTGRQISTGNSSSSWADMSSDGSGAAVFGSNVYLNYTDNTFRSSQTHNAAGGIGSRGLAINYPAWGDQTFFTVNGNTTADAIITPTNLMTVKATGNVGIGTTNPASKLQVGVVPTATANYPLFALGTGPFDGTTSGFYSGNANGTFLGVNTASGYIGDFANFQINGVTKFKIDSSGNITSSGTTSSTGAFSTSGNISTTGTGTITSAGALTAASGAASTSPTTGSLVVTGGAGISGALNVGSTITANGSISAASATSATSGANQSSPSIYLTANYWNGSTSAQDQWSIQNVLGTGTNPSSTLQFVHSGSSGASQYAFMNGNVGIGTTSPGFALSNTATNFTDQATNLGLGGSNAFVWEHPASNTNIGYAAAIANSYSATKASGLLVKVADATAATKILTLNSNGTDQFVVTGSGNVGIGTTSPTANLEVTSVSAIPSIRATSNQASGYFPPNFQMRRTGAAWTATPDNSVLGEIRFDGLDSNAVYMNAAKITSSIATNAAGGAPSYLAFSTASSGATATERVRIDSSGNVGIGTTSPSSQLHLQSASSNEVRVENTSGTGFTQFVAMDGATTVLASQSSGGVVGTNSNHNFTIRTNNSPRVTIDTSGNVGIGTTSPAAEFDVSTTVSGGNGAALSTTTAGNAPFLTWRTGDASNNKYGIRYFGGASGRFQVGAGDSLGWTEHLSILAASGNVGIGTTSPVDPLDIASIGTGRTSVAITNNNTSAGGSRSSSIWLKGFDTAGTTMKGRYEIGTDEEQNGTNSFYIFDGVNSATRFYIGSTGNVGIGTAAPGYKLDVQGGGVNASGGYTQTSDIRLKTNIEYLLSNETLEKISQLRGIRYDWKDQTKNGSDRQIGLIAQDVQKVFPEAVKTNSEGFLSVSYSNLVAPLIESVKELYKKFLRLDQVIEQQQRQIASVQAQKADKAEIEALKARAEKSEKENAALKARLERIEKMLKSK